MNHYKPALFLSGIGIVGRLCKTEIPLLTYQNKMNSGEIVKILDKEYVVTPCIDAKYACRMCAETNIHEGIPCIQSGQYCITDWNQLQCRKQLPEDCYLKPKE